MKSQVVFKIDKKIKDKAMAKAKEKGIALSDVLQLATRAFVEDELEVSLQIPKKFNEKTKQELRRILRDVKNKKNMSPVFDDVDDAIDYLRSK